MPQAVSRVLLVGLMGAACTLIALVVLVRSPHSVQFVTTQGRNIVDFTAEAEYWETRISSVGGTEAYREMADSVKGMTVADQHVVAHTFGKALYEVEGVGGFPVCDTEFSQGCFHQFFGSSIQAVGIEKSTREAKELCAAQNQIQDKRTCEHGLGHGILGYLGYDVRNLEDALLACKKAFPGRGLTLGCLGGAFMEYNIRALLQPDTSIRALSAASVYEPCDVLSGADKMSCVFWQPWWWHTELSRKMDAESTFRELGTYCSTYSPQIAQACFEGVGYMAPNREGYEPGKIARFCGATSNRGKERIWCWSYAITQITQQISEFDDEICKGLSGDDLSYCNLHEHDRSDIFDLRKEGNLQ